MRNLAEALHFEIPAVPFIIEKGKIYFGDVVFEVLNYKRYFNLMVSFYEGQEINVRYSVHLDGHAPYVEFCIQYQKQTRTVMGRKR